EGDLGRGPGAHEGNEGAHVPRGERSALIVAPRGHRSASATDGDGEVEELVVDAREEIRLRQGRRGVRAIALAVCAVADSAHAAVELPPAVDARRRLAGCRGAGPGERRRRSTRKRCRA